MGRRAGSMEPLCHQACYPRTTGRGRGAWNVSRRRAVAKAQPQCRADSRSWVRREVCDRLSAVPAHRGTEGSNPFRSSRESTNHRFLPLIPLNSVRQRTPRQGQSARPASRLFEHRVEHRCEVAWRGVDELQYLGGRSLLLQGLARLAHEPRILHSDDCLRREIFEQRDLLVGRPGCGPAAWA